VAHPDGLPFLRALLEPLQDVQGSTTGMKKLVFDGVETPYVISSTVVLRDVVMQYWAEVIHVVRTTNNVVALGSPGIGKTTTIPYLIRELLNAGNTVVLMVRSMHTDNMFLYKKNSSDSVLSCSYFERMPAVGYNHIPELKDPNTVLVIEPRGFQRTPAADLVCRYVLVCSPNEGHYKYLYKGGVYGSAVFLYQPLWELNELLEARNDMISPDNDPHRPAAVPTAAVLNPLLSVEDIQHRYNLFGGVPRNVFAADISVFQTWQENALGEFSAYDFDRILSSPNGYSLDGAGQFSSKVVGFESSRSTNFRKAVAVLLSSNIKISIWERHLFSMWTRVSTSMGLPAEAGYGFERYFIRWLKGGGMIDCRRNAGFRETPTSATEQVSIPPCAGNTLEDPIHAASMYRGPNDMLFVPLSSSNLLYDALLRRKNGEFCAFQCTVGLSHSANTAAMLGMARQLGCSPTNKLKFYYVVPEFRFGDFKTDPVDAHLVVQEMADLKVLRVTRPANIIP